MSSFLSKITTGLRGRAQKVVIYAPEGFGKSTLASHFPAPLFLDVEDSTSQLDVSRLGREDLTSLKEFESALAEVAKVKPCATLIVDTVDWLEQMISDAVIAEAGNPKIQGIEDFGYGKGYVAIRERMTLLLAKLDAVLNAGITVVLLAHSKVNKFEPPDGAGPFDRYELKLSKHVAPLIKEWADMLVFGNWRVQVREKDKNEAGQQFKGVGGKERLMHCTRSAAWDAKNRHGMADTEKWEIAVIEKAFRAVSAPWSDEISSAKEVAQHEVTATSTPSSDRVTHSAAESGDPELARICEPHANAINEYLRREGKVRPNETWVDMPINFRSRVRRNPAGFLKVVANGSEVAK